MTNVGQDGASPKRWISVVVALCLADTAASFETVMILAALKAILVQFNDTGAVGWIVASYLLVSAIAAAIGGRLADLWGGWWVLFIALAVSALGSLLSFMTTDLYLIYAGRALQGAAGAVLPVSMGLVRKHCPENRVSLALGYVVGAAGISGTGGLLLGAVIVDALGWHYIFAISGLFCVFALVANCALLPRDHRKSDGVPLDIMGGVLFMPAIVAVLIGIDMFSAESLSLACAVTLGGVGLLLVWIRHEYRHAHPLIDVRLLARRELAIPNIGCLVLAMGGMQTAQLQMLYLQQPMWTGVGLGLTATIAALLKTPATLGAAVAPPLAGHAVSLVGSRYVVMGGFVIAALGWAGMMLLPQNIWLVTILMAVGCSAPAAIIYAGLSSALVLGAPVDRTSEAAGVFAVSRAVGFAIGVKILMAVLAAWPVRIGERTGVFPSPFAYQAAFLFILVLSVLGVLVSAYLPGLLAKPDEHRPAADEGDAPIPNRSPQSVLAP